jgi:DHA1 family multidrug resistance protein-like MFS transporter
MPFSQPLRENQSKKIVALAGTVIGLVVMGDSLMYSLLPLSAASLGISLAGVGTLLSINRLIRLVSNMGAGILHHRFGQRLPFILSTILGLLTTLVYGLGKGFIVFLVARAVWGVAWSSLRQGAYQATWTSSRDDKGELMGILWRLIRLGSAISVLIGGIVFDRYGFQTSVWVILVAGLPAIPLSITLPWPSSGGHRTNPEKSFGSRLEVFDHPVKRWLVASALADGVFQSTFGSTVSLFLAGWLGQYDFNQESLLGIGTIAGGVLMVRWISGIFVAPAIGKISDKFTHARTAVVLAFSTLCAVLLVASGNLLAIPSLLVIFMVGSGLFVTLNASASRIAGQSRYPNFFAGAFNTAVDIGTALGPLFAFSLVSAFGLVPLYVLTGALQFLVISRYWWTERKFAPSTGVEV